jgi:ribosomal protein S18 acetylase RimI-like enzyme
MLGEYLIEAWHSDAVAADGRLQRPADYPGFAAVDADGVLRGHASYEISESGCYVVAIAATPRTSGVGSRLLEAIVEAARAAGCRRVWLITTNDNLDALRFYQRRGFRIVEVRPGAVDWARRTLKSSIPHVGSYGIPMRDELVLERAL